MDVHTYTLKQKEWLDDMDTLSLLFSELHLAQWEMDNITRINTNINRKDATCVVCGNATDNIVYDKCEKKCKYRCHEECLDQWIIYKGYGVYCMICGLSQNHNYITNIFNKSKYFLHA